MSQLIDQYIAFRYPNWMDFAQYQCRVQHLEGWAEDLMNDIIIDLLKKPADKLEAMIARSTTKIVNNRPTTELDKFVLAMIRMNARSKFASFRKNTVGQKIINTHGGIVEVATFTEISQANTDTPDECTYNKKHCKRLDKMHLTNIARLTDAGYPEYIIQKYREHIIESKPLKTKTDRFIIESLTELLTSKQHILCL